MQVWGAGAGACSVGRFRPLALCPLNPGQQLQLSSLTHGNLRQLETLIRYLNVLHNDFSLQPLREPNTHTHTPTLQIPRLVRTHGKLVASCIKKTIGRSNPLACRPAGVSGSQCFHALAAASLTRSSSRCFLSSLCLYKRITCRYKLWRCV